MVIQLPAPETLLQTTWVIIGFMFGRAFGKQLDQTIQETDWYKSLGLIWQKIVSSSLDFLHHFEIGLLLMVYFSHIPELYFFGMGLFIDDLPDIPARFKKWFDSVSYTHLTLPTTPYV